MNLFRSITGSDWRDALARSRTETNSVSAQIRAIISNREPSVHQGQPRSGSRGEITSR